MKIRAEKKEELQRDMSLPERPGFCLQRDGARLISLAWERKRLLLRIDGGDLLFFCGDHELDGLWNQVPEGTPWEMLTRFFQLLWGMGWDHVREWTARMERLENAVIMGHDAHKTMGRELMALRRAMLDCRRELLQAAATLRQLSLDESEALRLLSEMNLLQEYLTQVREAWQTELDIQANRIMRFFAVLAAFFLPPALISGWYGMNLDMPETHWPGFYPALAIAAAAVTVLAWRIFKRKRWI